MGEKRLEATVHGRVQGVNFRWYTRQTARRLGLTGWVRNLGDGGRVQVVAEGSADALNHLLGFLRDGPPMAAVDHVDFNWDEAGGQFNDFVVRL